MSTTETTLRKVYLIKVEPDANNNKYYTMSEVGDGTFKAEYGRVGGHNNIEIYPISKWDSKYREKLSARKGYEDKTHLFTEEIKKDISEGKKSSMNEITNKVISNLVKQLRNYANDSVERDYVVSSEKVTQKMIDEAQVLVNEITNSLIIGQDIVPLNKTLVNLFKIIPRKMAHVKDYLFEGDVIKDKNDLRKVQEIIHKEQQTLDVMAGQVSTNEKLEVKESKPSALNILDAMGLTIEESAPVDIPDIKNLMQDDYKKFKRAFVVLNSKTQSRFDNNIKQAKDKKIELLWHGSRNENWWSIINSGLVLRPANAIISGKMFGYGIYAAAKCNKSIGYTSLSGSRWAGGSDSKAFLALKIFHVGNQLKIKHHESWCYDLDYKKLKQKGDYDSLWAIGGADLRNDEYIIYTEPQCTIKFFVEIGR